MLPPLLRAALVSIAAAALAHAEMPQVTSQTSPAKPAEARLTEGNRRFQHDALLHPNQDSRRRQQTANGQNPIAVILACADSRVAPEVVFDQGLGDLFVIRVAGNVAGVGETASVEYAAAHLNVPVCVVLGHAGCGAVKAAVAEAKLGGNLDSLMVELAPAVERTRRTHPDLDGAALLSAAVETNVWCSIETLLRRSDVLRSRVRDGRLRVIGAVYDLSTGEVRWLGQHPHEAELVGAATAAAH